MRDNVEVGIKLLHPLAKLPEYKTLMSSGADLYSVEEVSVLPGQKKLISTGIALQLPEGYEAQVRSRSGLAVNGLFVLNSPGTIDEDYIGVIGVILANYNHYPSFDVKVEDRIAQLVVAPVSHANFSIVEDIRETERGGGGFGSTGFR